MFFVIIRSDSRKKSKPVIMFTGYESPQDVKIAKELGGVVTSQVTECTVLITDKIRRTAKLLCALGRGIPIVAPSWLSQSKMTKTFLGNKSGKRAFGNFLKIFSSFF